MIQILQSLSAGQISRETAVAMISLFYHLSKEEADALVGESGEKEEPTPEAPTAPPVAEQEEEGKEPQKGGCGCGGDA